MPAGWDQATSIPALQMVCEIGECILPVFVLRRRHRFVIKVNNPFILGVCIAEIGRGELEHLEGALRIGTYFAVGYSIQIIGPYCVKGARHDREVAPVRVVLVVIADNLREIVICLDIVTRNAVPIGIYFGELPLRQQFASGGGILLGLDSGRGVA